ncbi:MAG TPA: protoporphyrinogen oxidase [Micromonosporaceae bacterium]
MRIVVVGGGITGLAAALRLRESRPDARIVLVEQSDVLGGKLRTGEVAGQPMETGAETFLTRDPDGQPSAAVELARRVGLGDALRHPAPLGAAIAARGRLWSVPRGTIMGIPADQSALDGLARLDPARDADAARPLLEPDQDESVGSLVRRRFGDQVTDVLVDPLLGGVYAGRADDLSLSVTIPALAAACRRASTLSGAVRQVIADRPPASGPVFATVEGGLSRLVGAVAAALGDVDIRLGSPVRELRPTGTGWRLVLGSTRDATTVEADGVVLAVPSRPAARLLTAVSPAAAAEVGVLDYASVALVTLAVPAARLPELSGFLVPATEGRAIKAATFFTTKWAHHRRADGLAVLRASLGRYGDEQVLQRSDEDLVALVREDLAAVLGAPLPAPVDVVVRRWGGALPQYTPGHLDRVARARILLAAQAPTLALAGAGYDGVGIPACVRSGQAAADQVLAAVGESGT